MPAPTPMPSPRPSSSLTRKFEFGLLHNETNLVDEAPPQIPRGSGPPRTTALAVPQALLTNNLFRLPRANAVARKPRPAGCCLLRSAKPLAPSTGKLSHPGGHELASRGPLNESSLAERVIVKDNGRARQIRWWSAGLLFDEAVGRIEKRVHKAVPGPHPPTAISPARGILAFTAYAQPQDR